MIIQLCLFFLITSLFSYIVVIFFKKNQILIDKPSFSFHKTLVDKKNINNVPLCGGFILLITTLFFFEDTDLIKKVKLFSILIFFLGFLSDINKISKPVLRFAIQISIVLIFIILSDIKILDLRSEFFNKILALDFAPYIFATFCILIILNGSNFIDGVNINLLSYYFVVLLILIYLSFFQNFLLNKNIYILSIILFSLILFNFFGKLYMGDSGSYLLSFLMCFFIIEFHNLHKFTSPYFICLLLWYPAFETFFSITRRLKSNYPVSHPDIKHLHQLLFLYFQKKLKKKQFNSSLVSVLINSYNLIVFFICVHFSNLTILQILFVFLNIAIYLTLYIKLSIMVKKIRNNN